MLVGVEIRGQHRALSPSESLDELAQLATTAGATIEGVVTQRLQRRTPYYVGKGKLEEIRDLVGARSADLVVLDDELNPTQQRNLENVLRVKVIDRAALIIDIFASHARTREGRLQVDLAQHQYLLPRLAGQWSHLERLGGGIGTRGPGETQIETDRRLIRGRIRRLRVAIEEVRVHRSLYRQRRRKRGVKVAALVGYTNAGKSTLFNALSRADTLVQDQLFATLDPVTRRCRLPSGRDFLLTDTVGFINKLPTALVAAFRATLEELEEADVLVHVADMTHSSAAEQAQVVERTLHGMGLAGKPTVTALNKLDLAFPAARDERDAHAAIGSLPREASHRDRRTVMLSAAKRWCLPRLLEAIEEALQDESPAEVNGRQRVEITGD